MNMSAKNGKTGFSVPKLDFYLDVNRNEPIF